MSPDGPARDLPAPPARGVGRWLDLTGLRGPGGRGPAAEPAPGAAGPPAAGSRPGRPRRRGAAPPYCELRAASAFSFLDGASLPEDLVARAAELELPAVALVDRNGVYGAPRFYAAARRAGLRALVGAEVALDDGSGRPSAALPRLTLLVRDRTGYRNLCRLLTAAARGRAKGEARAGWELVAVHARGLHCLTGGAEGPVVRALAATPPAARRAPPSSGSPTSSPAACTSSCSATGGATRSTATGRSPSSPAACGCRWWPPTACATPAPTTSRCTTC